MTEKLTALRGYDDSRYLKEMADGIIIRRFASVEDAAKTVLGEETGSNIDRLRRKFREQNWYERGLNDYVDAEINRRSADIENPGPDAWFVNAKGEPMGPREITAVKAFLAGVGQITPTGFLAFAGVAATGLLAAMHMRSMDIGTMLTALGVLSATGMLLWARAAAARASRNVAAAHLISLVTLFGLLIAAMVRLVPDTRFTLGSLPGSALFALGAATGAVYVVERIRRHAKGQGRKNAPETLYLCAAIAAGGIFGGVTPLVQDIRHSTMRTEAASEAALKIEGAIAEIANKDPAASLETLREAERSILAEHLSGPAWTDGEN
jgi:hypothetical protein